jgi:ParB family chromosome partitioning protein
LDILIVFIIKRKTKSNIKMTKKNNIGLGKGLGALLPSSIEFSDKGFKFAPKEGDDTPSQEGMIGLISVNDIVHNPYQPRQEFDPQALEDLKNSIIEHGVIQPITVRRAVQGYELISGERRWRASIAAGLDSIPAYVLNVTEDVKMLAMALIENVQRHDLNPVEIANGYNRLIEECDLTQEEVAQKVGKERSTVTNFLRLLKLPQRIQDSLRNREISAGHARAIVALSSPQKMILAWREVCDKGLSVRATETLVKDIEEGRFTGEGDPAPIEKKPKEKTPKNDKSAVSEDVAVVLEDNENKLRHIFGTQVRIQPKNNESGKIEIEFYSIDDLERIIDILSTHKIEGE